MVKWGWLGGKSEVNKVPYIYTLYISATISRTLCHGGTWGERTRRATGHGPRATCHVPRAACHVPRAASWPLPRGIGPLQRASWQEKVARGNEMARKTGPEANFHGFLMKFHDFWHRIFEAILAGICYVSCIEILAGISVFFALARKT